jgi:cbb3-type cytochrome oxidase maturation protein
VSVLFIVLPLALLTVLVAVLAYSWATRSGQFEDLDKPGMRMLHDDVPAPPSPPAPQ